MWAVVNDASEVSERQAAVLGFVGVVVNGVIFWVLLALFLQLFVEVAPRHGFVFSDHDFVEICFADWALLVFQNQTKTKGAGVANVLVVALSQSEKFKLV